MRLGLFVALLIPLILIAGLVAPIPGGLPPLPPVPGARPALPQCLTLKTDQPLFDEWFPQPLYVELLPQERQGFLPEGPWYGADIGPDSMRAIFSFSVWQPAGSDSIDITWYHGPPIRIPARGDTRVGRITRRGYINFFHALLAPDRIVHVTEVPCPRLSPHQPSDTSSQVKRPHNEPLHLTSARFKEVITVRRM
jgi:hypothetical protein